MEISMVVLMPHGTRFTAYKHVISVRKYKNRRPYQDDAQQTSRQASDILDMKNDLRRMNVVLVATLDT